MLSLIHFKPFIIAVKLIWDQTCSDDLPNSLGIHEVEKKRELWSFLLKQKIINNLTLLLPYEYQVSLQTLGDSHVKQTRNWKQVQK